MEVKSSSFGGDPAGLRGVFGGGIWKVGRGTGSMLEVCFAECRLQPPACSQWCLQEWFPHFMLIRILLHPQIGQKDFLTVVAERLLVVGG